MSNEQAVPKTICWGILLVYVLHFYPLLFILFLGTTIRFFLLYFIFGYSLFISYFYLSLPKLRLIISLFYLLILIIFASNCAVKCNHGFSLIKNGMTEEEVDFIMSNYTGIKYNKENSEKKYYDCCSDRGDSNSVIVYFKNKAVYDSIFSPD